MVLLPVVVLVPRTADIGAKRLGGAGCLSTIRRVGGSYVFSDEEYLDHVQAVEQRLGALRRQGVDSRTLFGRLEGGRVRWSAARRTQHRRLLADLWEHRGSQVGHEGRALFVGGVDGAGKTTLQSDPDLHLDADQYLIVDPNRIKEAMAERGMIPQVEGLSPMEASLLVHEEASELAERLAQKAYSEGCNVLREIDMSSEQPVRARIEALRSIGYGPIDGTFADASVEIASERAALRHRHGEEAYRNGQGHGGRFTPQVVFDDSRPTAGTGN